MNKDDKEEKNITNIESKNIFQESSNLNEFDFDLGVIIKENQTLLQEND